MVITEANSAYKGGLVDDRTLYMPADQLENGDYAGTLVHEFTHFEEGSKAYDTMKSFLQSDEILVDDGEGGKAKLFDKARAQAKLIKEAERLYLKAAESACNKRIVKMILAQRPELEEELDGEKTNISRTEDEIEKGKIVADFIEEVNRMVDSSKKTKRKKKIGTISNAHAEIIESLMKTINPEFSAEGYELWIDGTSAEHIDARHGENGEHDHTMATREAKELIPWVASQPDSGDFIRDDEGNIVLSNRFFNLDKSKSPQIKIEKK